MAILRRARMPIISENKAIRAGFAACTLHASRIGCTAPSALDPTTTLHPGLTAGPSHYRPFGPRIMHRQASDPCRQSNPPPIGIWPPSSAGRANGRAAHPDGCKSRREAPAERSPAPQRGVRQIGVRGPKGRHISLHLCLFPQYACKVQLAAAFLIVLLLVSCRSGAGGASGGLTEEQELRQKVAALTKQEQVLSAELSLARNPAPYLAVDITNRKIELRAQGRSLRSFPIATIKRNGGTPFVAQTWVVIEAKPLQIQERAKVVPGSGESTTASVATKDPWGPKRMPTDYDLICKGARALEIRSLASEQAHYRVTRWMISGYRQFRDWMRDLWNRNRTTYKESLEIWMGEEDAKLLFWSLPKQFGILIQA
jgi:hypothetical protein